MRKTLSLLLLMCACLVFWVPASSAQSVTVQICGTVTSYTAATVTLPGSIVIGGQIFPIAAGTTIANANLITTGANLCLAGTLNASGQLIVPTSVTANVTATLQICGVISSYTAATAVTAGSITIGGQVIPIAAGTTISNADLIVVGANLCLSGTLNGAGQIVAPTSASANVTTTVSVCGTVTSYVAATATLPGSITIAGQTFPIAAGTTISNANLITLGANLCLAGTLNASGQLIVPTSVTAGATTTLQVCGVVNSYTAATAVTAGSITIGGQVIPIAAGTTITNADLLVVGANICLSGNLNAAGQIVMPTSASANLTTTVSVCGTVTSYTAATATVPGSITIAGQTFAIATGTTISNAALIVVGATLTLSGTLNSNGQLVLPSSVQSGCAFGPSADVSITKSASPNPVTVGQTLTYTLVATNNGPDAATGVITSDTLPASVTFISASASQGTCSGTTTVTCSLGTLANGASATVTITVIPTAAGTLSNTARVTSSVTDPNPPNNTTPPVLTTVTAPPPGASADVSITKSASPNSVTVGQTLTYTLVATNNGPDAATGVTTSDTLPASVTFISASASQGTCSGTTTVTCSLGTLANGASATVTIRVIATTAGTLRNTASVTSSVPDPKPPNNTTPPVDTPVVPPSSEPADLRITKTASRDRVQVGESLTYTMTVFNAGPGRADDVRMTDALPGGATFVSASPSQGSCTGTTTVTCALGSLQAGTSATVQIVVVVNSGSSSLINQVIVTSATPDPDPTDNVDVIPIPIPDPNVPPFDLVLTPSTCSNTTCVGGVITYTITVRNADRLAANDVTIIEVLSSKVRLLAVTPSQGSCSGTAVITCELGTLSSNASASIDVTVSARSAGEIVSDVTIVRPRTIGTSVSAIRLTATDCAKRYETYVPIAGRVVGGSGLWETALRVHNAEVTPLDVTIDWFPLAAEGRSAPALSTVVSVAPGESALDDVLRTFTGANGMGSLRLTAVRPFGVSTRISITGSIGTVADIMHGLTLVDALDAGTLMHLSTRRSSSDLGFRTNVGYFNPWREPMIVTFRAFTPAGRLLGTRTMVIAPFANALASLSDLISEIPQSERTQDDLYVTFQTSGSTLFVYGSVIDQTTSDMNFIEPWPMN